MNRYLIPFVIVASSACMLVFCVLCGLSSVAAVGVAAAPHVQREMQRQDAKLLEDRERLTAATIYKETAEQRLNRGDNEGVFRAKDEYDARLREIDERYSHGKFASSAR